MEGKKVVISGSGNVATHAAEKINQLGGKVLTLSDSEGYIYDPAGISEERVNWVKDLKNKRRGRISEYAKEFKGSEFVSGKTPWGVPCDLALPCATQNELTGDDARLLVQNGCIGVSEGANMPTTLEGVHVFKDAQILFAPGKAAEAAAMVSAPRNRSSTTVPAPARPPEAGASRMARAKDVRSSAASASSNSSLLRK